MKLKHITVYSHVQDLRYIALVRQRHVDPALSHCLAFLLVKAGLALLVELAFHDRC